MASPQVSPQSTPRSAPRRARRRRSHADIRRTNLDRILSAATEVFAETGFGGSTVAQIAACARVPKANVLYYFGSKEKLYRAVLARIMGLWLNATDSITPDADPRTALAQYVASKLAFSREYPLASKVFANELLHGGMHLGGYLQEELRPRVAEKAAILQGWIDAGRIAPIDPRHLFFVIWAATQTYADFDLQIAAVLDRPRLSAADYETGRDTITRMVLSACGLDPDG